MFRKRRRSFAAAVPHGGIGTIEDSIARIKPSIRAPWKQAGVLMTADVQPHEMMTIRLFIASHLAMAYLGALAGYRYVHEVTADKARYATIMEAPES